MLFYLLQAEPRFNSETESHSEDGAETECFQRREAVPVAVLHGLARPMPSVGSWVHSRSTKKKGSPHKLRSGVHLDLIKFLRKMAFGFQLLHKGFLLLISI